MKKELKGSKNYISEFIDGLIWDLGDNVKLDIAVRSDQSGMLYVCYEKNNLVAKCD